MRDRGKERGGRGGQESKSASAGRVLGETDTTNKQLLKCTLLLGRGNVRFPFGFTHLLILLRVKKGHCNKNGQTEWIIWTGQRSRDAWSAHGKQAI